LAQKSDLPSLIACRTTIGFGAPTRAGTSKAHGEALGPDEVAGARRNLNWPYEPFVVPEPILAAWRKAGKRATARGKAWKAALNVLPAGKREEFERRLRGDLPASFGEAVIAYKRKLAEDRSPIATRKASQAALEVLANAVPELLTGSADLTPSNNTKVAATPEIAPSSYAGRYIHWGIREHGMAAAVNGMALHGGFIPSGASFLTFSDYCRPALRLSALMGIRAIEVFTHDSIGLGEDGPTHQPVEHLAALRAMPNLLVFRPADRTETLECWQLALNAKTTPSILALTRQNLPSVRHDFTPENLSAAGAYELAPADGGPAKVSIFASGSEVSIALDARSLLAVQGIATRVVSVPCMTLFLQQDRDQRQKIIGDAPVRVGVEAAVRQGWDALIGEDGIFIGMTGFGASAPYQDVYNYFNITPEAVTEAAMRRCDS
jgi:transketolase